MSRSQAPVAAAPNKGVSGSDACSSSTLLDPSCSSTLRARLRSQDPVLEQFSASSGGDPEEELYRRFRACFALGPVPSAVPRAKKGTKEPRVVEGGGLAQLRETFAEAGLRFYASVAEEIVQARRDIDSQIENMFGESEAVLTRAQALYSNVAYPLSATLCHTEHVPSASIAAHLTALEAMLTASQDELHRLQREWETCIKEEQQAWAGLKTMDAEKKSLVEGGENDVVTHAVEEFKDEAAAIVQENEDVLDEIDAEFRELMQGETMRMMQGMMAS